MYAALIAKQQAEPAAAAAPASKPAVVGHFTDGHFSSGPPKGSAPPPGALTGFFSGGSPKGSASTPAAATPVASGSAAAPRTSSSVVTARPAAGPAELSALAEVKVSWTWAFTATQHRSTT